MTAIEVSSNARSLPSGWRHVVLCRVARLESGHTPSRRRPQYWGGNVPWISLHDTEALDSATISATAKSITEDGLRHSSARLLPPGTVVFSRTATVGKATVMANRMATSQDFANFVCGPELHNFFLMYLLRWMRPVWQQLMAGSIHNTIYMPVFQRLEIVLPPLPEQWEIARKLSEVDELLAGLQDLISKKRDLKQAVVQQLLSGQTRLPGHCGEWEVRRLGEVAAIVSGGTPRTSERAFWDGGIPWCTPSDITGTPGKFLDGTERTVSAAGLSHSGATLLPAGALLLCSRATIGELKIARHEVCTNQGFKSLVCGQDLDNEFLYYKLLTMKGQMLERAYGSTFLEISGANVAALVVDLPRIDEQRAIAEVLSGMDAELSALEARRAKTLALKQAMMHELLTGRTRLV